jgi:signal peptide peptidase SppA
MEGKQMFNRIVGELTKHQPLLIDGRCLPTVQAMRGHHSDLSGPTAEEQVRELMELDTDAAPIEAAPTRIDKGRKGGGIGVVPISGVAMFDIEFQPFAFSTKLLAQNIKALANDDDIGTIVLKINSPGGVVTGTPEAANAIFEARKTKKVVAVVDPLAASAAFWLASQAHEISVTESGDVGSIGVFMLHVDVSEALQAGGIKPTFIVSQMSPFKTEGNMFEPLTEEATEFLQSEVDDVGDAFLKAVARGRGITPHQVQRDFGGGRLLNTRAAKAAGMIDRIESSSKSLGRVGVAAQAEAPDALLEDLPEAIDPDIFEALDLEDEAAEVAEPIQDNTSERKRKLALLKAQ